VERPLVPVILCGGSGTRLWPRSNADTPKQLLRLVGEYTMLQNTVLRLRALDADVAPPVIVCNERHGPLVAAQTGVLGGAIGAVLLEPVGRNSAPALTVAAHAARALVGTGVEPLLLVLPADQIIHATDKFAAAVRVALEPARNGYLATFGVVPTVAQTGYGYIRRGADRGSWSEIAEFVEKPDAATAREYVESGRYLWNSGMFLLGADAWLSELAAHAPDILKVCNQAFGTAERSGEFLRLGLEFATCRSDSIDYAVMEKTSRAAVVPLDAGWSDVGSWSSLHDASPKDALGNASSGEAILDSCRDTYVASNHRLVAAIGLDGVIVVETEDAVLVVARSHAEGVRRVAELVGKGRRPR